MRRGFASFRQTIIWRLLARQRSWVIWMVVTASIAFTAAALTAATFRALVDDGVIARTKPIDDYVSQLITLAFWALIGGFAFRQVLARIGYHLEFELRVWLHERLQSTDPERLDALATGQMVTRAMTDLLLLELLIVILPGIVAVTLILLALAALMLSISPLLSLLAFALLPANMYIATRIRRRLWGMSWVMLDRRAKVTTAIDEAVRGARVVKAFGREPHELGRLADAALACVLGRHEPRAAGRALRPHPQRAARHRHRAARVSRRPSRHRGRRNRRRPLAVLHLLGCLRQPCPRVRGHPVGVAVREDRRRTHLRIDRVRQTCGSRLGNAVAGQGQGRRSGQGRSPHQRPPGPEEREPARRAR